MSSFRDFFGGGGSSGSNLTYAINYSQTGAVFTAPFNCDVLIAGVGAAGGGAGGNIALGGNSAPWALKKVSLVLGQTLTMTIGAGGTGGTSAAGSVGATSSVSQSGVGTILTITGGEGGAYSVALVATNPAAIVSSVTGADVWFAGLQSGAQTVSNLGRTGGAAVNISGDGTGRSPNLNSSGSTCGGSVGITPTVNDTTAKDALPLTNFGAFGLIPAGSLLVGKGANGTGGVVLDAAPFGGGGGTTGGAGGIGGYGGGGGGGSTTGGRGGGAYFTLYVVRVT